MDKTHTVFKKQIHFGEAYIIKADDGTVITKGQGQFDTEKLKIHSYFNGNEMGTHEDVMLVLKTDAGYFAPLRIYTKTLMPMGGNTWIRDMDTFLHWPKSKSLKYVTESFSSFDIFIKTAHINVHIAVQCSECRILMRARKLHF